MAQIIPIELEDGTMIYMEAQEENRLGEPKRGLVPLDPQKLPQPFQAIKRTVRAYTTYTLGAFKNLAIAEISEVNLEFGVKINATTGVPFIAAGSGECNVKISVKCTFPKSTT